MVSSAEPMPIDTPGRWEHAGCVHDPTEWPLVVVTLAPDGSDEDWRRFLERIELCFDDAWRRAHGFAGRYCTVLDLSAVANNDARRRREWAELMARHAEVVDRDLVASGVVITSALGRFIFAAVTWLEAARGVKRENAVAFADRASAEAWCREQLHA